MSLLWHGFDRNGMPVTLVEHEVRKLHGPGSYRYVHDGRLRITDSAEEAQRRGWRDVAALFSTNPAVTTERSYRPATTTSTRLPNWPTRAS